MFEHILLSLSLRGSSWKFTNVITNTQLQQQSKEWKEFQFHLKNLCCWTSGPPFQKPLHTSQWGHFSLLKCMFWISLKSCDDHALMLCNDIWFYITAIYPLRDTSGMLCCNTGQEGSGVICTHGCCFRQSQAVLGAIFLFCIYVQWIFCD